MRYLLPIIKIIYARLPEMLCWIIYPAKFIGRLLNILRLNIWLISGREVSSKQELVVLYAGNEVDKEFIAHLAFGDARQEKYIGKLWLWKVFNISETKNKTISLVIVEIHSALRRIFNEKKYFYIPCWVGGEVDISVDFSLLLKNDGLYSDVRRIRKNKLTFEVINEQYKFHEFYYNMYLPYVTRVYSNKAFIMNYDDMMKKHRNCDLLIVKKEDITVAGILIIYSKKKVRLWSIGIKDGNINYLKDGVTGALDYFSALYLKEEGYKKFHFGESRPFLKDGVLQFKKKWNQEITEVSNAGFLLNPLKLSEGLKGFLTSNPFIRIDKKGLSGTVFSGLDGSLSKDEALSLAKKYFYNGLSTMNIYRFTPLEKATDKVGGEYKEADGGSMPPYTVKERSSLTGFTDTNESIQEVFQYKLEDINSRGA